MPRYAAAVDANQSDIVAEFRARGATVKHVHTVKKFVDIVVGYRGVNLLVEIKDGSKPPSEQKLTTGEQEFQDGWRGQVCIINDTSQVEPLLREIDQVVMVTPGGFAPIRGK